MSFQENFQLGNIVLPNNIFYAPLAGCSDLPYRRMSSRYRPGLIYCEMVKMDALIRHDSNTYRILDYEGGMHPIGGQICGSKPEIAAESAKIIEDLGFDVVDLNCGCPVDKVTKDGSGSGMLKTPDLIGEIIIQMKSAVKIPVTVKIRAGWDENSIVAPMITRIAEEAGADAICIHGRTREQGYVGNANWDWILECKKVAKKIIVIGNGDVFDAECAKRMFLYTGCDAVLVSRGTMGQPWVAEDIMRLYQDLPQQVRTPLDIKRELLEHLEAIKTYQNERRSLLDFRRVACYYLKKCHGVKALRSAINQASGTSEVFTIIDNFDWEEASLSMQEQI